MAEKNTYCWVDSSKKCDCTDPKYCPIMHQKFAKLVFCNDHKCIYNVEVPFTHYPNKGQHYKPFVDDGFNGICSRPELAMQVNNLLVGNRKRRDVVCSVRSDKKFSHLHLPDPDKIEHHMIDDPKSSDYTTSTYHT